MISGGVLACVSVQVQGRYDESLGDPLGCVVIALWQDRGEGLSDRGGGCYVRCEAFLEFGVKFRNCCCQQCQPWVFLINGSYAGCLE